MRINRKWMKKNDKKQGKGILWLIVKLVALMCCLMKGKDCVRFVFFIIFLFKFWGFCTVLLLITKNIGNAPFILKIISQCSFILFENANFILLLLQSSDNFFCSCKFLLITCYKILTGCSLFECVYFTMSVIGFYND